MSSYDIRGLYKCHINFWLYKYLESRGMVDDMIKWAKDNDYRFSEVKRPGQWTVADDLEDGYKRYKETDKKSE